MATNTEHYNLVKPATTDFYGVSVQNSNMDIIDTVLFGKLDKVAGKSLSTNDYDNPAKAANAANTAARHTHSNKNTLDAVTAARMAAWDGKQAAKKTATVTLPETAWENNFQTVSVEGVTDSNTVVVSPEPHYIPAVQATGIICESQGIGTLTFHCDTVPNYPVLIHVLIWD